MNHLTNETSPYLLQHKDNPVHWFAWGEAAFEAAREQQKPIFLSIGYSTCYWCHMMEKDSFERDDVAAALNQSFICIKVDREERPDIDAIYMDAVVGLSGHGGWPMSMFLTPELKPFFGGTFFYREQFLKLLDAIKRTWENERGNVVEAASRIEKFLKDHENHVAGSLSTEDIGRAASQLLTALDATHGGFGGAPKFPQSERIAFLLRQQKPELTSAASLTLTQMAFGGIYDQLGGGFARYATDREWIVPHFEKMLYDNGQLAFVYLEAFQATGEETFRAVGLDTLQYLMRDMRAPGGAFYAAEDAGDAGREGEFYVWSEEELKSILDESELAALKAQYEIPDGGNFEHGKIILCLRPNRKWSARFSESLKTIHLKLLAARNQRPRPHRDDKILTSWNALAISAFAKAFEVTLEQHYLDAATAALKFIREELFKNDRLLRSYAAGSAKHHAYLDDYAFLICALLDVYEQSGDETHALWAIELQNLQDKLFWDETGKGYFFSNPDDTSVILRKKSFHDGAEPAGNAIAAKNLLRLFSLTGERSYQTRAEELFTAAAATVAQYSASCSGILMAFDLAQRGLSQIVAAYSSADENLERFRLERRARFLPFSQISFVRENSDLPAISGKPALNGKTTFYLCQNQTCSAPIHDPTSALNG